jgi:hypothetical protein
MRSIRNRVVGLAVVAAASASILLGACGDKEPATGAKKKIVDAFEKLTVMNKHAKKAHVTPTADGTTFDPKDKDVKELGGSEEFKSNNKAVKLISMDVLADDDKDMRANTYCFAVADELTTLGVQILKYNKDTDEYTFDPVPVDCPKKK